MENETLRLTLALITVVLTAVIAIYLFFSANKTHKKYISNLKELVKVKENLIETKTELIRKVEENKELNHGKMILSNISIKTREAMCKDRKKLLILHNEIQSIGRRISIKDLEAFKQRCAEIYNETETEKN